MKKHLDKYYILLDITINYLILNKRHCQRNNNIPPSDQPFMIDEQAQRLIFTQTASTEATTI